jgi:hypothetical protein
MTTFVNQSVGSFDDRSHEFVEVWFDEAVVSRFAFHSVMQRDVMGASHRLFGIEVEARYVFAACNGFNTITNIQGIAPDGSKLCVTHVLLRDQKTEEFRLGDKYGKPIARMRRTGYVQAERAV